MTEKPAAQLEWVPRACILPTAEQPVRTSEFEELFRHAVAGVDQPSSGEVRLTLHASPDNAARAARLAAMESGCCSFFTFDLAIADGELTMTVSADQAHEQVLTAFATRARPQARGTT